MRSTDIARQRSIGRTSVYRILSEARVGSSCSCKGSVLTEEAVCGLGWLSRSSAGAPGPEPGRAPRAHCRRRRHIPIPAFFVLLLGRPLSRVGVSPCLATALNPVVAKATHLLCPPHAHRLHSSGEISKAFGSEEPDTHRIGVCIFKNISMSEVIADSHDFSLRVVRLDGGRKISLIRKGERFDRDPVLMSPSEQ